MPHEYSVSQDGADFYLNEGSALVAVLTFPPGVFYMDLRQAQTARDWVKSLAMQWGLILRFTGEI